MEVYRVKSVKLRGTKYSEVWKVAFDIYLLIKKSSKRRVYLRSAYFNKKKVFLSVFWHHQREKLNLKHKTKRLKYFPCALELIKYSKLDPISKENVEDRLYIFHRFAGITADGEVFFVQIKENRRNGQKYLISVFPLIL